jgi:hypothetical protein
MESPGHMPDYGLVQPVTIPPESKIPDAVVSTSDDYDLYFRIVRDSPNLITWSRTCLQVLRSVLADLDETALKQEEKYHIVRGFLLAQSMTLEKWVKAGEAAQSEIAAKQMSNKELGDANAAPPSAH